MFGDDDTARNIWNEMQRDAAPSAEEAKAEQDHFLSSKGCLVCGESDPDKLRADHPHFPNCPAVQQPSMRNYEPDVWCQEHYRPSSVRYRASKVQSARHRDDVVAIAWYDCGSFEWGEAPEMPIVSVMEVVGVDDDGEPIREEQEIPAPGGAPRPKVSIECVCGAPLTEVVRTDGLEKEP